MTDKKPTPQPKPQPEGKPPHQPVRPDTGKVSTRDAIPGRTTETSTFRRGE